MYKVVEPIKKLISVKHFTTSDIYFSINTKLTAVLLVSFSVLLSALDILRTSIDCYTENNDSKKAMMDNYCWSIGTYICKDRRADNLLSCFDPKEDNKIYQRYYQWISLVFIIQAAISYIPAYLWKMAEGGLLHKLCDNLDASFGRKNWNEKKDEVVNYFSSHFVNRAHQKYTNQYIGCKMLSITFIIMNIVMLNMIIPEFWSTYSEATTALLGGNIPRWTMYSDLAFPKMAKCEFKSTGPSGTLQKHDALCLLPLNVLNQKIFVIVWLWFIVQLIVSILNLVYWIVLYYSENIRVVLLRHHTMMTVSRKQLMQATNKMHMGNFFVLHQIAKNTNATTFVELVSELSLSTLNQDLNANKSI